MSRDPEGTDDRGGSGPKVGHALTGIEVDVPMPDVEEPQSTGVPATDDPLTPPEIAE